MAKLDNLKPFKPGQSGNPAGRRQGSRVKLSEAFLAALCDDFLEHGVAVIAQVRAEKPDAYLKIIASLLPKQLEIKNDPYDGVSDEQLVALIQAADASIREFMAAADVAEDEGDRVH